MDLIESLLSAFETLTAELAALITDSPTTYLVVFALVALDVLFPVLPGEGAVLVAGVMAGTGRLSIEWVILAATLGAFVGDNVAFWIGRRAGRPLAERILRGHPERIDMVAARFAERGGSFIIIGRFLPGGRTAVAIGAGVLHFPWLRFAAYDAVAAIVWGLQAAIPGYIGGTLFADRPWIGLAVGIAVGVAITLVVEGVRRTRSRAASSAPVDARASGSGIVAAADAIPVGDLDRRDGDPRPDGGAEKAVVAEPKDRAGTEQRVPDPGAERRERERHERVPADAPDDDEEGARAEGADEERQDGRGLEDGTADALGHGSAR